MKWKERAENLMLLNMIKKEIVYIFYDCSAESPKGRRSILEQGSAGVSVKNINPKIQRD